jgi:hypothetical protein
MPSHEVLNSELHIEALPNAAGDKVYSLPLLTNIFFPSLQRGEESGPDVNVTSYFTIIVLPPKNVYDYIQDIQDLASWISPINSVWTFIAAVGAVLVPFIIRQYSKKQNKKTR